LALRSPIHGFLPGPRLPILYLPLPGIGFIVWIVKLKPAFQGVGLLVLLSTGFPAFHLHAARAVAWRYHPTVGQTNVYKVQIELHDESGTNKLAGNLMLVPRQITSNTISLAIRGNLHPQRDSMMRPMPMPMSMGPAYPRFSVPMSFSEGTEIIVDPRGKILRSASDNPLPAPLGSVAQLLLHSFPANDEKRWEISEPMGVMDEPLGLGPLRVFMSSPGFGMPYGGFNPRQSAAFLSGLRTARYEWESPESAGATLKFASVFKTDLRTRTEPRIQGTLDGRIKVDRATGFLQQSELKFQATSETDSLTRRTDGFISIQLLEGDQREAVLTAMPSASPAVRKLTAAEVQEILKDANSANESDRRKAASRLQNAEISEVTPELMQLAEKWAFVEDTSFKVAGGRILTTHATREQVPLLLKLLKQSDHMNRYSTIQALGRLKDPSAAQPLVDLIARGADHYQAAEALAQLGPDAEEPVLQLFQQKHVETLRAACNVLKQIGTAKSIEPIKALMLDSDQSLSSTAGEAYRAIQARQ
jgi:hypothetical protein